MGKSLEVQKRANDLAGAGQAPALPNWDPQGVPYCSERDCTHYDGKRCELMGQRPSRVCEPAVQALFEMASEE